MSNYTPSPLTGDLAAQNAENEKIAAAIASQLDRNPDVGQSNQMETELDMNSNKITNLAAPESDNDAARKKDLDEVKTVVVQGADFTVQTISDLRTTEPATDGQVAFLVQHTQDGRGGGNFYYDESDTTSSDNNGTVIVTANGARWKRFLENNVVDVDFYGAIGTASTDTSAFIAAVNDSELNNYSVYASSETYTINSTINIGNGVPIYGQSQSSTIGKGTTILHQSNDDCFYYDSSNISGANNTGGGISKMLIVKANGFSGGSAIKVFNSANDGVSDKRASTFNFEELTIQTEGSGLWQRALDFDGLQYDTPGSRGLRNFSIYKVRVSGCTEDYEYCRFSQLTHFSVDMLQIDTGTGTGLAGLKVDGYTENMQAVNCVINGRLVIPTPAVSGALVTSFQLSGKVSEVDNQRSSTIGAMYLSNPINIINEASGELRIYSATPDGLRFLEAGPRSGYSERIFSLYSGSDEIIRYGTVSDAIQTVGGLKNDGQYWIYANRFDYETSSIRASIRIEYGRIRPSDDDLFDLGTASQRFSTVYASNGTIDTSDEREKTELLEIEEKEKSCALELKSKLRKYKFISSVNSKGEDARIHWGIGAQTLGEVFRSHGLDPDKYGMFCYDEWEASPEITQTDDDGNVVVIQKAKKSGNRYGVRYSELFSFILAAM